MRYVSTLSHLAAVTVAFVLVLNVDTSAAPVTTEPQPSVAPQPHWTPIHAKVFPGCVGAGSFIPARIVVVPRDTKHYGEAHTMRYSDATVARINATWNNEDPADDLFTIGKCAR